LIGLAVLPDHCPYIVQKFDMFRATSCRTMSWLWRSRQNELILLASMVLVFAFTLPAATSVSVPTEGTQHKQRVHLMHVRAGVFSSGRLNTFIPDGDER